MAAQAEPSPYVDSIHAELKMPAGILGSREDELELALEAASCRMNGA
jgi:hypothetical protein